MPSQKLHDQKLPGQKLSNAIRVLAMDAVQAARSGHPGMPMGMAEVATILYARHLKFSPENPDWQDRDRFILSAGHGSMLIYALLYLTGYEDIQIEDIKNFRQLGSPTAGHPEYGHLRGIETTTGPLGQGLANAVGMALAEAHLSARFGAELVDHYSFVIAGDGCLMEGISHEAASMAGHFGLGKLILLFDDNGISIDGATNLTTSDDISARFEAYGWQVLACDGHDMADIDQAIAHAKSDLNRPSMIRCRTIIGKGAPNIGGTARAHGAPLGDAEIALVRKHLNWPDAPFTLPDAILSAWREIGARHKSSFDAWTERLDKSPRKSEFLTQHAGNVDEATATAITALKADLATMDANTDMRQATRVSSQKTLEILTPIVENLFGGSADLTGSNNTKTASLKVFSAQNPQGRYVHYGVREHGMAAAMNGMALHGGLVPYGGTFLVFSDYCRPSIRLSALMKQRVIYVMTHDSIGLGEDGPTHQPIEHLAALRAIPNLHVWRPADNIETAEAWQNALANQHTPSILALSRQALPQLRHGHEVHANKSSTGGYILREASQQPKITLCASGSEVALAAQAQIQLEAQGHPTRLVSVPCLDILLAQDKPYRDGLIGGAGSIVVIEAGIAMGWGEFVGANAQFVTLHDFGASAPAENLFTHFGLTVDAIISAATA